MDIMDQSRFRKGCGIIFLAALFVCASPIRSARAGGEPIVETTSDDKTVLSSTDEATAVTTATANPGGLGIFSRLPFHVTLSVRGGYDDNVNTSSLERTGSWFTSADLGLLYKFGSPRTQINLTGDFGLTYYFERPNSNQLEPNLSLGLSLTHKFTPRLTLSLSSYASYQVEPNFGVSFGVNRRSGNYFYSLNRIAVSYQVAPRFSAVTSYSLGALRYDDNVSGQFQNRLEHTISEELRFLWLPTTTLTAEYRFGFTDYLDTDRQAMTHYFLGGIDHSFSPRLNASLRAGAEFRHLEDATFGTNSDTSAPYAEATVNYALGRRTSVSWTSRYALEEPDIPGSSSRQTFRTGLQAKYGITPRITLGLGAFYQHDDNSSVDTAGSVSPAFVEDSLDISLTARYAITRYLAFDAGYTHTEVFSDLAFRDYARNRVFAGATLSF